jgi:excisionase family DNA binding protein
MTDNPPRWATSKVAREYLGVSETTLYRYVRRGLIAAHTVGRTARYDLNELDAILRGDALTPEKAVAVALDRVRELIPDGRPLIPRARVLEILDTVAAGATAAGATHDR